MTNTNISADALTKIAEKYIDEYEYVCIRTQEVPFEFGKIAHTSANFDDGEKVGELDGLCGTYYNAPAVAMHTRKDYPRGYYYGDYLAIICSNDAMGGEDEGECILKDAVVVEIIK